MTAQHRAARRFSGLSQPGRDPRPCVRCGEAFTPPELHPGRSVCSACRDSIRHPGRRLLAPDRPDDDHGSRRAG
jgi:hypothetical protein